jgi:hypothetical protein
LHPTVSMVHAATINQDAKSAGGCAHQTLPNQ